MVAIPTTSDKNIIPEVNLIILSNKEPILKVPNALSSSGETVFKTFRLSNTVSSKFFGLT